MFQIRMSETLLCSMLPLNITNVLPLDMLWQLMASAGIVRRSVVINDMLDAHINDTLDAHICTKYFRTSTQFLRCKFGIHMSMHHNISYSKTNKSVLQE
jgi:hypothetical protein